MFSPYLASLESTCLHFALVSLQFSLEFSVCQKSHLRENIPLRLSKRLFFFKSQDTQFSLVSLAEQFLVALVGQVITQELLTL